MDHASGGQTPKPKKLLDQARDILRMKHSSYRTEETYVYWMVRYILFHKKRHPKEMGAKEVGEFLGIWPKTVMWQRVHRIKPLFKFRFGKGDFCPWHKREPRLFLMFLERSPDIRGCVTTRFLSRHPGTGDCVTMNQYVIPKCLPRRIRPLADLYRESSTFKLE